MNYMDSRRQFAILSWVLMAACLPATAALADPAAAPASAVPMSATPPAAAVAPGPAQTPVSTQSNTPAPASTTTITPAAANAPATTTTTTPAAATATAPATTTTTTTSAAAPVATTQADDAHCPCDYNPTEALANFNAVKHGAETCSVGGVIMIGSTAVNNTASPVANTALLMTMDSDKAQGSTNRVDAMKSAMTAWEAVYGGNAEKDATNYCLKNRWDPSTKRPLTSLTQYQACVKDIKAAAKAVGLTCGE